MLACRILCKLCKYVCMPICCMFHLDHRTLSDASCPHYSCAHHHQHISSLLKHNEGQGVTLWSHTLWVALIMALWKLVPDKSKGRKTGTGTHSRGKGETKPDHFPYSDVQNLDWQVIDWLHWIYTMGGAFQFEQQCRSRWCVTEAVSMERAGFCFWNVTCGESWSCNSLHVQRLVILFKYETGLVKMWSGCGEVSSNSIFYMLDIFIFSDVEMLYFKRFYTDLKANKHMCRCFIYNITLKPGKLCSHAEREVVVEICLWYAWQTMRSMLRSISRRPPGIIMQLEPMNAAPGTTICWHTKGTVSKIKFIQTFKVIAQAQGKFFFFLQCMPNMTGHPKNIYVQAS